MLCVERSLIGRCFDTSNLKAILDMVKEYRADIEAVKKKARARVDYLVRQGRIKKPARCQACGRDGILEAHHQDYGEPEKVLFWCVCCHRRYHRRFSRRTVFELFPGPHIIDNGTDAKNSTKLE